MRRLWEDVPLECPSHRTRRGRLTTPTGMTIKSQIGYLLRVGVACEVFDVHIISLIKFKFLIRVRGYARSCLLIKVMSLVNQKRRPLIGPIAKLETRTMLINGKPTPA